MNRKTQIIIGAIVALVLIVAALALVFGLRGGAPSEDEAVVDIYAAPDTQIIVQHALEEETPEAAEETTAAEEPAFGEAETFTVDGDGHIERVVDPGVVRFLATREDVAVSPWTKTLMLEGGTSTAIYPFTLPEDAILEDVDESISGEVAAAFEEPAVLPTMDNPIDSESGFALLVSEGMLVAEWTGALENMPEFFCAEPIDECRVLPIYTPAEGLTIENVAFYGPEDQFVVLDLGAGIFLRELDRRGDIQNIQPVVTGAGAAFRIVDGDLYVRAGGETSRVDIDDFLPGETN